MKTGRFPASIRSNNNYTLNTSTVTVPGEITAKPVTLADGTLTITKGYDGTNNAGTATGVLASTDFVSGDDAAVGTEKSVDLTAALTGSAASNYSLANSTYNFKKAEITKAMPTVTVTVTGVNGEKPTGTVNFKNGSTDIETNVSVINGVAAYEWVKPSASINTITADFTPTSDNYNNATGKSEEFNISKAEQAELKFADTVPATVNYEVKTEFPLLST